MQLNIQAVNLKFSQRLEDIIRSMLDENFGQYTFITRANVFLKLNNKSEGDNKMVEIHLHLKNHEIFAKAENRTFEFALDEVFPKLKKQIEKYKGKVYNNP
jgi:putative sigma-54 modulation protein